jgi:hypothetical protein
VKTDLHLIDFWTAGDLRCVLFSVDRSLELRLYDRDGLIALEPCDTAGDALDIARAWRENVPRWPPF